VLRETGTSIEGWGRRVNSAYVFGCSQPYIEHTMAHLLATRNYVKQLGEAYCSTEGASAMDVLAGRA
jgi:hypothetical protein